LFGHGSPSSAYLIARITLFPLLLLLTLISGLILHISTAISLSVILIDVILVLILLPIVVLRVIHLLILLLLLHNGLFPGTPRIIIII